MTTPMGPATSACRATSTTVLPKFGSASDGSATRKSAPPRGTSCARAVQQKAAASKAAARVTVVASAREGPAPLSEGLERDLLATTGARRASIPGRATMSKSRRSFLAAGAAAGTASLGFPMIARAQQAINWKMTSAYGKGAPFYMDGPGSATDLAKRIEAMSNGRLKISVYGAGELIPALEGFDAVRSGTVEMNHANSYFWTGKTFAAQYFTAVPFGLNFQGMNGWLYDGGGIPLWHEVYKPFGTIAFPCGNTGVQMTGWFKKEIKSVADFKGLKMRIPGLAGKVYASLGVDVKLLPGGEIFPALERGVIDAAEFVGPYQDRRMGLNKAAKFYHTTGWHETATVSELLINKAAWDKLPKDLQAIVENACAA